jgi:hypothetical protein
MRAKTLAVALVGIVALATSRALPAKADDSSATDASLARAKELFRQGVALFEAGQVEHALDLFLQSRAVVPAAENTLNAALCLDRLERWDEALELYEEMVTKFGRELSAREKEGLAQALSRLRAKMGAVDVVSNVQGAALLVDGRPRGNLPRNAPLPVLAGNRVVRVFKDGYKTFATTVTVVAGARANVDAVLEPLAAAGQLRVQDPDAAGADLFVDRVLVGRMPWEGTLGPGRHVIWEERDGRGSAPFEAIVVQGQLAVVRLRARPLGQILRVEVQPGTAVPSVDGVSLGAGSFIGRLPIGAHTITIDEPGYFSQTSTIGSDAGAAPLHHVVTLAIDRAHPRWPKPPPEAPRTALTIGGFGGYAFGEEANPNFLDRLRAPNYQTAVDGVLFGLRAGYRLRSGLSLELSGGYVSLTQVVTDATVALPAGGPATSANVQQIVRTRGGFAALGASVRLPSDTTLAFVSHVMAGLVAPTVTRSSTSVSISGATQTDQSGSAKPYLFLVDVGLEATSGRIHAGLLLGGMTFATYFLLVPEVQAGYSF